MRGGCSPESVAREPASLTRTAGANVCPASWLTAMYTSVGPSFAVAPHATAARRPLAAIDGFALVLPLIPSSRGEAADVTAAADATSQIVVSDIAAIRPILILRL